MEGMETLFVVMESGAMKKDEKTAENMGRKGRKSYEQNLEYVSRGSKKEAGADRSEYIREGERDETLQDAVTCFRSIIRERLGDDLEEVIESR